MTDPTGRKRPRRPVAASANAAIVRRPTQAGLVTRRSRSLLGPSVPRAAEPTTRRLLRPKSCANTSSSRRWAARTWRGAGLAERDLGTGASAELENHQIGKTWTMRTPGLKRACEGIPHDHALRLTPGSQAVCLGSLALRVVAGRGLLRRCRAAFSPTPRACSPAVQPLR